MLTNMDSPPIRLKKRRGLVVAVPAEPLPPLTAERVRKTLERMRRRSLQRLRPPELRG
jgi:hypothetical protein